MSELLRESYYKLVNYIREYGDTFPKRHGKWVRLRVGDVHFLTLDTWSKAICLFFGEGSFLESGGFAGTPMKHLGIDFGGFNNKEPEIVELLNTSQKALSEAIGKAVSDD